MITVYFDGKCGLCSREIRHYMQVAPQGVFEWCDITQDEARLAEVGTTLEGAMRLLHVKDHYGHIHTGVDGFILMWRFIPAWQAAAELLSVKPFKTAADRLYRVFADWRYEQRSQASGHATCTPTTDAAKRGMAQP